MTDERIKMRKFWGGIYEIFVEVQRTGFVLEKRELKKPLGRPRLKWEDNIKMYIKIIRGFGFN